MTPADSPSGQTDLELLRRTARGDKVAFEALYDRFSTPVYNYLVRLIHEIPAAEDLTQEVYLAVWQGAGRFQGRSTVKTWLFRIAHNKAVSWLRRIGKGGEPLPVEIDALDSLAMDAPNPEAQLLSGWQTEQIVAALDGLSEVHRGVIELAFVHEFSYAEIAEIMACPDGTVKSRMSYALRHLAGILQRTGVE
jgi:RNA polymerase sigma-70 factor (ECF subfamily)